MRAVVAIPVLLLACLAVGCGGGGGGGSTQASTEASGGCRSAEAPAATNPGAHEAPSRELDPAKTYTLAFDTSCGSFTVTLDPKLAPHATASLVALARNGYFDDTIFHRVVRGFVIQGGDPTQTGGGGPGYSTVDPPPSDASYTKGVVAMAKTEAEPPGTSGSQFFVVTAADAALPPDYAIVGKVTKGMDAVERIDALGAVDEQGQSVSGAPTQPVVVSKVTVGES